MATRWSSDYSSMEIRDFDAQKMVVDYTGSIVLLAGRKQYGIVEIYRSPNIQCHRSFKYNINAIEWNPTHHNQHVCAIAYDTNVQLLGWKDCIDLVTSVKLNTHTRTVLDVNWHCSDPNSLATSSMDSFTHIWDIRETARPAISLSAIVPASKVRWNHITKHLLATAHGGDLKVWDQRKPSHPLHYISAHLNTIHCLDWSYTNEHQLATSSQNNIVKFFEINNLKNGEKDLDTVNPVSRAKYSPFCNGILIVAVPNFPENSVENNLKLWSLSSMDMPVHTFVGHSDTILEFQWLRNNEDKASDYELITWSKDQTIRLWHVVPYLYDLPMEFNYRSSVDNLDTDSNTQQSETTNQSVSNASEGDDDALNEIDLNFESEIQGSDCSGSSSNDSYNCEKSDQKPSLNLHEEFLSLDVGPEVFIEQKDPDRRILIAVVKINNNSLTIHMTFPLGYPVNVEPLFQITKCTYEASMKNKIHKILYDAAVKQVAKHLTCVQYCLRELVGSVRKTRISFSESQHPEDDKKSHSVYSQSPSHYDRLSITALSSQDSCNLIQHKTMGLKFCNNGALLWFNSPVRKKTDFFLSTSQQKGDKADNTPLQKLQPFWLRNQNSSADSNNRSLRFIRRDHKIDKPTIAIYDVSCLFPINKDLASRYELDVANVFGTCLRNAWITNGIKRKDLVQTWTLAAYASNINCNVKKKVTSSIDEMNNWKNHPFTRPMIDSLITHYAAHSDFQTAALLCCVFNPNPAFKNIAQDRTPTPVYTRSNSLSEGFIFSRGEETNCFELCDRGLLLLDDSNSQKDVYYDEYRKTYMDVLDNLGLLDQQACVKKFLKHQTHKSHSFFFNFVVKCKKCKNPIKDGYCFDCDLFNVKCSLCNTGVRGAALVCLKCGHGGHSNHLIAWFSEESLCSVNCGCCCLFETMSILHINRNTPEDD